MVGLQGKGLVADAPDTLVQLGVINSAELIQSLAELLIITGLVALGIKLGALPAMLNLSLIG